MSQSENCQLCNNAKSKYSCPQCNIPYCSLSCYQSYGHTTCTEKFYYQCIKDELQNAEHPEEMEKKMVEILKRVNQTPVDSNEELDSDDDEECPGLLERLKGVNLDDANEVWGCLNPDEKQGFETFLRSEEVSKIIPHWTPWWSFRSDAKVTEVGNSKKYTETCPEVWKPITEFDKLTSKPPSEVVKNNLVNIIAAFVFTARYFNGDYFDFPQESSNCILTLSHFLKSSQNFEDFDTAIKSVQHEIISSEEILTDQENLEHMKEDTFKVLKGPTDFDKSFYVLCCLSEVRRLFETCLSRNKTEAKCDRGMFDKCFPGSQFVYGKELDKKQLKLHLKTTDYYLSYVEKFYCGLE